MLPDVDVDDGYEVGAHIRDQVLIRGGSEAERVLVLVVDKPSPATTLNGSSTLVENFDKFVDCAPSCNDGVIERTTVG